VVRIAEPEKTVMDVIRQPKLQQFGRLCRMPDRLDTDADVEDIEGGSSLRKT